MKSVPKLIKRLIKILIFSFILLVIVNITVFSIITINLSNNGSPWKTAEDLASHMEEENGKIRCNSSYDLDQLNNASVWAMYIDNSTMTVQWHTDNIPTEIPDSYNISGIASLTRGYIKGYPTFTSYAGANDQDLVVLGYPKDSYWKLLYPAWDYQLVAHAPQILLIIFLCNLTLIILIYVITNTRLLKSVNPIVNGIQKLPTDERCMITEQGVLSELAININHTAQILDEQEALLKKKDTARANWIAGVSHDIRTPLAMVMGYASQIENSTTASDDERKNANAIIRQSERMKNLVNDLNLASKLEYNMQPVNRKDFNLLSLLRQLVVDFMNLDLNQSYPIEWMTDDSISSCVINGDPDLCKRAITNIIQNSINHNPVGCNISIKVTESDQYYQVSISDNGIGVTKDQIDRLNHAPHYMVCDDRTTSQRHGLGLLIVKQIMSAHQGMVQISQNEPHGFQVELFFLKC